MSINTYFGGFAAFGRNVLVAGTLSAITLFMGGCQDNISDRDIEAIPLAEVRQLQAKGGATAFIDPRSSGDFSEGRIPGAMNLTLPEVPDQKDSLDPRLANYKSIVVYGDNPGSAVARAMTKRLMRAGAKNVRWFSGGMAEWKGNGLKVEQDAAVKPVGP